MAVRLGRLQILVTGAVVVAFFAATAYTQYLGRLIDRSVTQIAGIAMPGLHLLAEARSEMHWIEVGVDRYVGAANEFPEENARSMVDHHRRRLGELLIQYNKLPQFPGQWEVFDQAEEALRQVDQALARLYGTRGVIHRRDAYREVRMAMYDADRALRRSVDFVASQGQRLAEEIRRVRRRNERLAYALDAVALTLAIAATAMTVQATRRSTAQLELGRRIAEHRATLLEERASELEEFAGRVAHDVLSPLGGVGLALQAIERRDEDERTVAMAVRGTASLRQVRRIVDDLLEFARAGAKPAAGAVAEVAPVLYDVIEGLRAEAAGERVGLRVEPFEARSVACAPGVLMSLFWNLIGNAIKHMGDSPERHVTVRVEDGLGVVRMEVEDSGEGIPGELGDEIFKPFVRAGSTQAPGIGLGLATVRRLVVRHGGRVGYRSARGRGSLFWFELPRAL